MAAIHSTSRQALARSYGIGLRARTSSRALISAPLPPSGTSVSTSSTEWSFTPRRSMQRESLPSASLRSLAVCRNGGRRFASTNAAVAEREQESENEIEQDGFDAERVMTGEQNLAELAELKGSVSGTDEAHSMMPHDNMPSESVCWIHIRCRNAISCNLFFT
jgi:hypothetical protein